MILCFAKTQKAIFSLQLLNFLTKHAHNVAKPCLGCGRMPADFRCAAARTPIRLRCATARTPIDIRPAAPSSPSDLCGTANRPPARWRWRRPPGSSWSIGWPVELTPSTLFKPDTKYFFFKGNEFEKQRLDNFRINFGKSGVSAIFPC